MARRGRPPKNDTPITPTDILEGEIVADDYASPNELETPFDKAYGALTCTTGPTLEMMTRATPKMVKALNVCNTMAFNYGSAYLKWRADFIMRMHVSMGGKGRGEIVQMGQAGAGVPGEFYNSRDVTLDNYLDYEEEDIPDEEQ